MPEKKHPNRIKVYFRGHSERINLDSQPPRIKAEIDRIRNYARLHGAPAGAKIDYDPTTHIASWRGGFLIIPDSF